MFGRVAVILSFVLLLMGCKGKYYEEEDFNSVPKVDAHVHINSDDGIFEEAATLDNFMLISFNVDHPGDPGISAQQQFAIKSAKDHPGKIFWGATFLFDTTGFGTHGWNKKVIDELSRAISFGPVSIKIWKNIGMTVRDKNGKFIMVDNPALDSVFAFIQSKGLPVTGHLGEPRNCWLPLDKMTVRSDSSYYARHPEYHMFLHPDFPSYEDQIDARDNFLRKNPDLKFIGCHLGSLEWNVDSLAARLDRFPNMAVDMSARICHLQYQSLTDRDKVRNFMIKYQDRILYGTDAGYSGGGNPASFEKRMHETWIDDWKYLATDREMISSKFDGKFRGLKLPGTVIDKIYFMNAVKWYNLPLGFSM
jgi:predicted TIM-barrel fold metal-dependent hydrolase